ncbi:MAG: UDP-3-O-(3-hydroxymyristoyl)glucosamine N-acyltransferase [bacterium]
MEKNALFTVKEIAGLIEGEIVGNPEVNIYGLNRIEDVKQGELTFYSDKTFEKYLNNIQASCIIVQKDFKNDIPDYITIIKTENPYLGIVKILKYLDSLKPKNTSFIHPTAVVDETTKLDKTAYIGPNCIVGKNCAIAGNVFLHSNITLYENVEIGENTLLHSGVICCNDTKIGKDCIIHPGVVIGSDGFGYIEHKDGSYEKIPQLGNVIIEDDVEIGSNTTIDRALIGSTIIGKGVKIDNLCQVGHNVKIGENTALVSQVGIAGSCNVGKRNRLGGQVGLAGHLETADDVVILAQSGVAKSVEKKGMYFGSPIKERLHAFKIEAVLNNLPELARDVAQLKRDMAEKS